MLAAAFACNSRRRSCTKAIPPAAKLPQRRGRGAIRSQIGSDDWKPPTLQKQQDRAANRDREGETEKQATVSHHLNGEYREGAEDRAEHHRQRQARAKQGCRLHTV